MNLRNNGNTIAFLIIATALITVSLLWFAFKNPNLNPRLEKETYSVVQKWKMPKQLNEISGITWIGDNKLACVQDEEGLIFIYDLPSKMVEKTISFSEGGDYEGITIADSTIFVLRSDGKLFEVKNYLNEDLKVNTYDTPFAGKNNMESLTFDSKNNRLLMMPKDNDLDSKNSVGIYSFNLETKKVETEPLFKVAYEDPIFKKNSKKKSNSIHPSDIAISPINGNFYILEGKNPQLLVLDAKGKALNLHKLNKKTFNQPEGIIFSPEGVLYISNEGKKGTANILQVKLDQ